jgi:hypothetical protein
MNGTDYSAKDGIFGFGKLKMKWKRGRGNLETLRWKVQLKLSILFFI